VRRIVDAWMQHPSRAFLAEPMFESLRRWSRGGLPTEDIPLEQTIEAMDEACVSVGLLCAWWGPRGPLITNDEVAACVKMHSSRFVGVASVDLHRPMTAVRELRRCVHELGFRALRIVPWLWDLPPDDRRYYPLYAECIDLGIPFCLQVGHTGPLCPSEPGRPIPYLDRVALEFPELVIVGGHIGYPWTTEMISLATKYPNVYIDTSAYTVRRYPRSSSRTCGRTAGGRFYSARIIPPGLPSSASKALRPSISTPRRPISSFTETPSGCFVSSDGSFRRAARDSALGKASGHRPLEGEPQPFPRMEARLDPRVACAWLPMRLT
jgi:predicted TIM-barrel fold metal-dependent hydrolase